MQKGLLREKFWQLIMNIIWFSCRVLCLPQRALHFGQKEKTVMTLFSVGGIINFLFFFCRFMSLELVTMVGKGEILGNGSSFCFCNFILISFFSIIWCNKMERGYF